jgi:hypothetical protein
VERQAELYSAALLMPREHLRAAMPKRPWRGWPTVYRLADLLVVNVTPMKIRLKRLDWIHLDQDDVLVSGPQPTLGQGRLFGGYPSGRRRIF